MGNPEDAKKRSSAGQYEKMLQVSSFIPVVRETIKDSRADMPLKLFMTSFKHTSKSASQSWPSCLWSP